MESQGVGSAGPIRASLRAISQVLAGEGGCGALRRGVGGIVGGGGGFVQHLAGGHRGWTARSGVWPPGGSGDGRSPARSPTLARPSRDRSHASDWTSESRGGQHRISGIREE